MSEDSLQEVGGARTTSAWRRLWEKYRQWWPVSFFLLGFIYDAWSLDRIDSAFGIIKHGSYLGLSALLLSLEILALGGRFKPRGRFARAWEYHEIAVHFFLGSLLSEYTLFFFKSASLWSSFFFMTLLGGLLVVNEFKQFKGSSGIPIRAALFSICLISYLVYLVPLIQGHVGTIPFILSLVCASLLIAILARVLRSQLPDQRKLVRKQLAAPFAAVLGVFATLYFTKLIPPIPLAVRYVGIYHSVKKENGKYILGYTRPDWKFWQSGDQDFQARPGDQIVCFVRVFSPGGFRDQIQVRWLFDDPRLGWTKADAIPIAITGGRGDGYRGVTHKSNYQPGDWQVRVETTDGRELSRIYFTVEQDDSVEQRQLRYDIQ